MMMMQTGSAAASRKQRNRDLPKMKNKFGFSISSPVFLFQQNVATQKLKKAWQDIEKRQSRILRNMRVERNRLKSAFSDPSGRYRTPFYDADADEGVTFSKTSIPGFRFTADGEPKKSAENLRRERLRQSLTVLGKHGSATSPVRLRSPRSEVNEVGGNAGVVEELDSAAVEAGEEGSRGGGSSSSSIRPVGGPHRYSVGNTCGYKVDSQTRHVSCFNICPMHQTQSTDSTSLLDPTPSLTVRQVQKQLGLNTRSSEPTLGAAAEAAKEIEQLERAINVLQMTISNPEVDLSMLEPLGEQQRKILQLQVDAAEAGPKRRHCEACGYARERYEDLGVDRTTTLYNKPRWQIAPVGRYVPAPTKKLVPPRRSSRPLPVTKGSNPVAGGKARTASSTPRRPSSGLSIMSPASLSDAFLSADLVPTSDPVPRVHMLNRIRGKGHFDAMVSMMAAANRPETNIPLPDVVQQPSARIFNRQLDLLRSRHNSESGALLPKVRNFLDELEEQKNAREKRAKSAKKTVAEPAV